MKVALGSDVLLTSTISFSRTPRCAINWKIKEYRDPRSVSVRFNSD